MNVEQLEKLLDTVRTWIIACDQKISIGLVLMAATISIITKTTYDLLTRNKNDLSGIALTLLTISAILFVYGLIKLLMAVSPRTSLPAKKSLIYFGTIAKLPAEKFKKSVASMSRQAYKSELIDQIYVTSVIASNKHSHYKDAVTLFVGGLFLWLFFALSVWVSRG